MGSFPTNESPEANDSLEALDTLVNPNDAWKIPTREEACAACAAALEPGSEVTVRLTFGEEGPQRRDLCTSCGESVENEEGGIFWKREQPEPGDNRVVVDYVFLQEMFTRMLDRSEDVYRRLSYLVGLVLIRKRFLRLKGFAARDGREVMMVTRGVGHPELVVPAPFLSAEDMSDTRDMLTRLLAADLPDGDLPEPSQAATATDSPADEAAEDRSPEARSASATGEPEGDAADPQRDSQAD